MHREVENMSQGFSSTAGTQSWVVVLEPASSYPSLPSVCPLLVHQCQSLLGLPPHWGPEKEATKSWPCKQGRSRGHGARHVGRRQGNLDTAWSQLEARAAGYLRRGRGPASALQLEVPPSREQREWESVCLGPSKGLAQILSACPASHRARGKSPSGLRTGKAGSSSHHLPHPDPRRIFAGFPFSICTIQPLLAILCGYYKV